MSSILLGQKGRLILVLVSSRAVVPARMVRSAQLRDLPYRDLIGERSSRAASRFLLTGQSFPGEDLKRNKSGKICPEMHLQT